MLPTTKPDKKVPTHGPGTTAWYRGKEAKILAIENGKAKIFCDGRVLLVNYTSLDDASFKTLHEAYRVVDNETHKSLFTGTKDECESFISDECDEDADVECIELKEAIMVPSDGMNPQYTLEKALSYAKGNAAAMIATNPLLYGIAALQRKYVVVCNVLDDEGTENPAYKKLDKDVRAKYHKLLSIPGESGKKYEVFGNKDNTSFLLYYEDAFTTNWFVPAAGKINEAMAIKENVLDQKNIVANLSTGTADTFQKVIDKHPRLTLDPLFYGVAALCYKWRRLAILDDWFEINDEIRNKYDIRFTFNAGRNAKIYLFAKKISSTVVAIKYESPESGAQWYLPANGKLNEGVVINESEAKLDESIMVSSDAMDKNQTLGDLVADLRGNVATQFASNPVLNGIATLQRNYVPVWDYDYETETESKEFKKLDKDIRSKFHRILSIPGNGGSKYEVYANKDNTSYLLYYSDMGAKGWYVPASGKINESEAQDKYQEFFKKKLADYGVSSPAELSAEDKSKFFSEIKKEWDGGKVNESITIPTDYQYPLDLADEIGLEGKELALAKKYLGNSAVLLPTYDPDEGKEVKEGLKLKALLPKAKILGTVGSGRTGGVIAYKFPKGTVALYVESEYEDPYFLLKPTKSINEGIDTGMAFGIGSTVNYNGKTCKVVSIANGKCKLVCGGEVLYTDMDQLKPSTPVNEALSNTAFDNFYGTLQKAKNQLPTDIFELFAKEYFLAGNLSILNEVVDNVLSYVDNSPIKQLTELAKKFNKGQYHDKIKNFIYFTNKLNDCRTNNLVFDQSYWDSCLALLIALGRSPMAELNEVNADSIFFMPFKNTVTFADLSASCVEAINNVASKLPNCKIGKKTATKIDVIL